MQDKKPWGSLKAGLSDAKLALLKAAVEPVLEDTVAEASGADGPAGTQADGKAALADPSAPADGEAAVADPSAPPDGEAAVVDPSSPPMADGEAASLGEGEATTE